MTTQPTGRRWPIRTLRVLCALALVQTLTQAALAGGFITGDVGLLGLHSANGAALSLTASLLVVGAGLLVWPGRGPWWPIVFTCVFWFVAAMQLAFGYARQIGLHVPFGMVVMGMIAGLTWWSFGYCGRRAGRPGSGGGTADDPAGVTA